MDNKTAKTFFEKGGTFIAFDVPKGTEIGIDMQSWHTGDKFKGIKMIPPGLHFLYYRVFDKYNQSAPLVGFFHFFKEGEILVKNYDTAEELLCNENDEVKIERIKENLNDLDHSLGPYPLDSWSKWVSLSQHIDEESLSRLNPVSGRINSAPEYVNTKKFKSQKTSKSDNVTSVHSTLETISESPEKDIAESSSPRQPKRSFEEANLPEMVPVPGTEINFSRFPDKPYKDESTPSEISKGSLDSTYTIDYIFEQLSSPKDILGEIQFSFVSFLVAQSMDAFEQWKRLFIALCNAEQSLIQNPSVYKDFLSVLYYQIQEVPQDLFVDIVENNNFVVASLRYLFANVADNAAQLPDSLVDKSNKFRHHLTAKFGWHLELGEDEEDLPVIVEL